ncbi:MAG: redox-regulated ATPase YchF [Candidatus Marinimicrobia bacterium]|nr:redox-regulated ATPase YchF [Candidatus Neomarinimicrobiota bacterium]
MGFRCGIVGLPNIGKSTLFNALTNLNVPMDNYPFCTIEPHIGIVEVPDQRLEMLAKIYQSQKTIHTTLQFVDIAGLVEGASKGEGLGNQFLSNIQAVDAIIHLVRCFEDKNISHKYTDINPERDYKIVEQELLARDLEVIRSKMQKVARQAKTGETRYKKQLTVLEEIERLLNAGKPAKVYHSHPEEEPLIRELGLLTNKPVLIVANISEDEFVSGEKTGITQKFETFAVTTGNYFMSLSANLELELAQLEVQERKLYMKEFHIHEIGLKKLISIGYTLLDLITFYTVESNICQAWTVKKNSHVDQASEVIHTSFPERFIKADVRHWKDVEREKSDSALRENGHLFTEGRKYILQDGDVITYKLANG